MHWNGIQNIVGGVQNIRSSKSVANRSDVWDEANEAPFSLASLPNGWQILFANDHDYASDQRLAVFSEHVPIVAARINETTMICRTSSWMEGRLVWSVLHDCRHGLKHLDASGTLPEIYAEIRTRLLARLERNGGENSDTDYVFDVPVELAAALTGYRHDQSDADQEEPVFNQVLPRATTKRSLWRRLWGQ